MYFIVLSVIFCLSFFVLWALLLEINKCMNDRMYVFPLLRKTGHKQVYLPCCAHKEPH